DLRLLPTTMKKIVTENLSILTTSDEIERRADAMVDEEVRAELDRERATTHTARHSSTSIASTPMSHTLSTQRRRHAGSNQLQRSNEHPTSTSQTPLSTTMTSSGIQREIIHIEEEDETGQPSIIGDYDQSSSDASNPSYEGSITNESHITTGDSSITQQH
ncbi:hypothetical protein ADUPG1_003996, partial [Aduncisulcus paluster]